MEAKGIDCLNMASTCADMCILSNMYLPHMDSYFWYIALGGGQAAFGTACGRCCCVHIWASAYPLEMFQCKLNHTGRTECPDFSWWHSSLLEGNTTEKVTKNQNTIFSGTSCLMFGNGPIKMEISCTYFQVWAYLLKDAKTCISGWTNWMKTPNRTSALLS